MIEFILNDTLIRTDNHPGKSLLDFIRLEMGLTGTKAGCREGDCGACTVMLGELSDHKVKYKTVASCLTMLGSVHGKHVVSIEGLNGDQLSHVQKAIVDHSGTQCGFCTPGFVISLVNHSLSDEISDYQQTIASIDGNICRCTGYKSIERAAHEIWEINQERGDEDAVKWMVEKTFLPEYFLSIPERLAVIESATQNIQQTGVVVAGATDLMVQQADNIAVADLHLLKTGGDQQKIRFTKTHCFLDAGVTAAEIMQSEELQKYFPDIQEHFKLISSSQIRNVGTLGGNIVNASPIGDLIIYFLALDAVLLIENNHGDKRETALRKFFKGYKTIDLNDSEFISEIIFLLPDDGDYFNYEKVSKREHLDIASVNTAVSITLKNDVISNIHLSAGGIAPVPLYLKKTCEYLIGKKPILETLFEANAVMQKEISPIGDIRGSEQYKRLLLRQLFFAHFLEILPEEVQIDELLMKLIEQ